MKRSIIAVMLLSWLVSPLVFADPPHEGDHHGWRREDHGDRGDRRDWRGGEDRRGDGRDRRDWRGEDHRGDWRDRRDWHGDDRGDWRGRRGRDFDDGAYRRPPGYYYRSWRRGERLPIAFRAPAYVIPDAAYYHLAPPPPGYYWVRVDNNAVLAAIATGVVFDVVTHAFH
jgi:Ni/Co efflux regulator RcnB